MKSIILFVSASLSFSLLIGCVATPYPYVPPPYAAPNDTVVYNQPYYPANYYGYDGYYGYPYYYPSAALSIGYYGGYGYGYGYGYRGYRGGYHGYYGHGGHGGWHHR